MRSFPDIISSAQCQHRHRSYQKFSRIGEAIGVMAAVGLVLWKLLAKEPMKNSVLDAVLIGIAACVVVRAYVLMRQGSLWRAGSLLVGAAIGLTTSVFTSLPALTSLFGGIGLAGSISARRLEHLCRWSLAGLVGVTAALFRSRMHYLSGHVDSCLDRVRVHLAPCAYREAVASGEVPAIFATALNLSLALWSGRRAAESPTVLTPVIALAEEEHAILDQAILSNVVAMGFGYCGDYLRGVALLSETYEDCVTARDKEIAATRQQAESAQLRHSVVLIRPGTMNLRDQIYLTANNLMVLYQDMGAFDEAVAWGRKAIDEAEIMAKIREEIPLSFQQLYDSEPTVLVWLNLADLMLDSGLDPDEVFPYIAKPKKLPVER